MLLTADTTADQHPSDAEFAEFLEGRRGDSRRPQLIEHFTQCDDCRSLLAAVSSTLHDDDVLRSTRRRGAFSLTRLQFWASAAAVAAIVSGTALIPTLRPSVSQAKAPLVAATALSRCFEGRLTGGFEASALQPVTRSGTHAIEKDLYLAAAASRSLELASSLSLADRLANEGVVRLVIGRPDEGIERLREALSHSPANASLMNDLAVALLEQARRRDSPHSAAEALELVEQALEREPSQLEPLFNRALALDRLGMVDQAEQAYLVYLGRDPGSRWSELVRVLLTDLRARRDRGVGAEKHAAREAAWSALPLVWARAIQLGLEPFARSIALTLTAHGAAEATVSGDTYHFSLGRSLGVSSTAASPTALALLSAQRAGSLGAAGHWEEAARLWTQVDDVIGSTLPGLGLNARLERRIGEYRRRRAEIGPIPFRLISTEARTNGFRDIEGRALWMEGLVLGALERFSESIRSYDAAAALARRGGNPAREAAIDGLLAQILQLTGNLEGAWRHRQRALLRVDDLAPQRAFVVLHETATAARIEGLHRVALLVLDEAWTKSSNVAPGAVTEAQIARAEIAHDLGRRLEAGTSLARAKASMLSVPDSSYREQLTAAWQLARARTLMRSQPADSVKELGAALEFAQSRQLRYRLPVLLTARAEALWAQGAREAARSAAEEAIAALEDTYRSASSARSESGGSEPSRFLSQTRGLIDSVRRIAIPSPSPDDWITFIERFRWRPQVHENPLNPGRKSQAGLASLRSRLSSEEAILWLVPEPNTTWVVSLTAEGSEASRVSLGGSALDAYLRQFRAAAALGRETEIRALSAVLLSLVPERLRSLERVRSIAVVADGSLASFPYASLREPGGHRLGSRIAIVLSMSGDHALQPSPALRMHSRRIRIVGNPQTDDFDRLPGAQREALALSKAFPAAEILIGPAATRSRILDDLSDMDVLHLSLHALPGGVESPRLIATDGSIDEADLVRVRMKPGSTVVLSACESGAGDTVLGEAPRSMARAFVKAGAGHVLATTSAVPDDIESQHLLAFHRSIGEGKRPPEAFRDAMNDSSAPGGASDSFILLGSLK